jgi:hypothetical protein
MVCWQRCRKQIKACVQLSGIPPRAPQSARHSRLTGQRTDPPVPLRVRATLMQRGRSSAWPWAWLLRLTSWKSSGEPAVIDRAIACCMALADSSMRCRGAAVDGGQPALSSEHRARHVCPTGVPARAERDSGVASAVPGAIRPPAASQFFPQLWDADCGRWAFLTPPEHKKYGYTEYTFLLTYCRNFPEIF